MLAYTETGRRHTRPLTTTHFTQAMNQEGYISFLQVPHRRHHLQEHRKGREAWECPFQKTGECRSTSAKPAGR